MAEPFRAPEQELVDMCMNSTETFAEPTKNCYFGTGTENSKLLQQ